MPMRQLQGPARLGQQFVHISNCGWAAAILCIGLLFSSPGVASASRHRVGPVFIRGTVSEISIRGFRLVSPSKGTLAVETSNLTTYKERSRPVRPSAVQVGAHVGVHGYLSGRTIRAVSVTIYVGRHKAKPKEFTLRGTVIRVGTDWINVALGKRSYHIVLAPGAKVEYRLLPARLSTAKSGQRVDVRYYVSGGKLLATRVELLVIHIHHPRTHTEYGTVSRLLHAGFVLETIHGQQITVIYGGRVRLAEMVSVRGRGIRGAFQAEKVHQLQRLPVHTTLVRGSVSAVGAGWIHLLVGGSIVDFTVAPATHVSQGSLPSSASTLRGGQYVSVRFWWQGATRVATSIHIYARIPVPKATGAVKGTIASFAGDVITVRVEGRYYSIDIPATAHIRDGSRSGNRSSLRVGQLISVRYYQQGSRLIATSLHIYASRARQHTYTGTVVSRQREQLRILDRGVLKLVELGTLTKIRETGRTVRPSALQSGQKVRVTGTEKGNVIQASRIDILPLIRTKTGHLQSSFRGPISSVGAKVLVLKVAAGSRIKLSLTPATRVIVRKRRVPESWLFSGPTATVSVYPSASGTPQVIQVDFHPPAKTLSGDVAWISRGRMQVMERKNRRQPVNLAVAAVTDDGRRSNVRSVQAGLHVAVDGFLLPGRTEAALTVAISHPTVRMSGTVTGATGRVIAISRTSGQRITLHFGAGVQAFAKITGQWFWPARIPPGARLSVRGVEEAGWVLVRTASLTLKSTLLRGVVDRIYSGASLTLYTDTGGTVLVNTIRTTKISAGRQPVPFGAVEIGDDASIRAYPDAGGGVLASSIDLHRKLTTRTGFVANLTSSGFDLVLRDGSALHFFLSSYTKVEVGGRIVPLDELTNGEKVRAEGHLRPDGYIDAIKVDIVG